MTSAVTVANKILELASAKNLKLSPLQLMKLVYMSQGWNLALNDAPLFDDRIEAWQYGHRTRSETWKRDGCYARLGMVLGIF